MRTVTLLASCVLTGLTGCESNSTTTSTDSTTPALELIEQNRPETPATTPVDRDIDAGMQADEFERTQGQQQELLEHFEPLEE